MLKRTCLFGRRWRRGVKWARSSAWGPRLTWTPTLDACETPLSTAASQSPMFEQGQSTSKCFLSRPTSSLFSVCLSACSLSLSLCISLSLSLSFKDRLPDRHSCLNLYPCIIKVQSINQSLCVCTFFHLPPSWLLLWCEIEFVQFHCDFFPISSSSLSFVLFFDSIFLEIAQCLQFRLAFACFCFYKFAW